MDFVSALPFFFFYSITFFFVCVNLYQCIKFYNYLNDAILAIVITAILSSLPHKSQII